ncbi:MAG: allose kinase [Spirochaetaceae bacterium]|jgi:allose kinase|nr:allose kinase [Spirochaetaceae bacterium]
MRKVFEDETGEALIAESGISPLAVSAGMPSTVSKNNRTVFSTPNIGGFDNIDAASPIEEAVHLPAYISRDVCLQLICDLRRYNLGGDGFIPAFYIGTGLGNAISLKGEIITGKNGVAAELGHIPMAGKNDPCGCGNRGCAELYASGRYLEKIRDAHFPDTDIKDIFIRHGEDPLIETFFTCAAMTIAAEITILDPEMVVLGGGVIMQKGFPREKLERAIKHFTRKPYPSANLEFVYSEESRQNGVTGAGIFGFQKTGRPPQ